MGGYGVYFLANQGKVGWQYLTSQLVCLIMRQAHKACQYALFIIKIRQA
jgi:hypothetical protein